MILIWRLLLTLLTARFRSKVGLFDKTSIKLSVLPTDIDFLMHMNNGRYLSLTDLGRIDFMIRNQSFDVLRKHGIYPVVASEMIRFKKSLNLFKRFEIKTQLVGWDERYFYVAHTFMIKKEVYALALIKVRFLHKSGGKVSPHELLKLLNYQEHPNQLPDWINFWHQAEKSFHDEISMLTQ